MSWEEEFDEMIFAYNRGEQAGNGHWDDGHGVLAISTSMQDQLKDFIKQTLTDVIGKNEPPYPEAFEDARRFIRNRYRAEQRRKAGINKRTKKGGKQWQRA